MSTTTPRRPTSHPRSARRTRPARAAARRRRRSLLLWGLGLVVLAGTVAAMLLSSRPTESGTAGAAPAPAFTLTSTEGRQVNLGDYRGRKVVLYFNEGVGCDACFYQMADIEKHQADLDAGGITVLPVVMNGPEETRASMARFGLRTPYLIDGGGRVSAAYGVLGKGMHAGLPGHSFVYIDAGGAKKWYGEYPTMFLPANDLLAKIRSVG